MNYKSLEDKTLGGLGFSLSLPLPELGFGLRYNGNRTRIIKVSYKGIGYHKILNVKGRTLLQN